MNLPNLISGSKLLQQVAWKSKIETNEIDPNVSDFINYIFLEAIGNLENLFGFEQNDPSFKCSNFSIEQLNKAETILIKQKEELSKSLENPKDYSDEFYQVLPIKIKKSIANKRILFERFELIQLLRDMLNVNEATNWNFKASVNSKYKSLGSFVRYMEPFTSEYSNLCNQITSAYVSEKNTSKKPKIIKVFEVLRPDENFAFKEEMDNQRKLFHGSKVNNFVGILSRGLLPPKFVVDELGGTRSDVGLLGSGIYFSESLNTSLKYAHLSQNKNTRLIAICDVALGNCKDYYHFDSSLIKPPEGYDSTHGVKKSDENKVDSKFEDSEYVIYDQKQQRIRYVVELQLDDPSIKPIQKEIYEVEELAAEISNLKTESNEIEKLEKGKNVLEKVESCLMSNSGQKLPLKSVHVRAQIVDMVSKVTIYQEYENEEDEPIEAKYVFPLDDSAAVCGFEAFINDKHVIGICKEKEEAHREYKEAIEQGKGAYLMDQESAELFKVNVGNLPRQCRCIIKITYVSELDVQNESIIFKLPNSVASWQILDLEKEKLQENLLTKFINKLNSSQKTSFMASIMMPFEIKSIKSPTHKLKLKKTACQAVCELDFAGDALNQNLILQIDISSIHMPRMLVEDSFDKNSRAMMVSFYPEFETNLNKNPVI